MHDVSQGFGTCAAKEAHAGLQYPTMQSKGETISLLKTNPFEYVVEESDNAKRIQTITPGLYCPTHTSIGVSMDCTS